LPTSASGPLSSASPLGIGKLVLLSCCKTNCCRCRPLGAVANRLIDQ
jgi:hypothetical protein